MYVLGHPSRRRRLKADKLVAISVLSALFTAAMAISINRLVAADTQSTHQPTPPIVLSEVQTGGCSGGEPATGCIEDARQEFVEIYNLGSNPRSITGYKLQYVSASGATVTTLAEISTTMPGRSYLLTAHAANPGSADVRFGAETDSGKLAKSGGVIRLVNETNEVLDAVGWGTASNVHPWQTAAAPKPGYSISRNFVANTTPVTYVDYLFGSPATPTTPTHATPVPVAPTTPEPPATEEPQSEQPAATEPPIEPEPTPTLPIPDLSTPPADNTSQPTSPEPTDESPLPCTNAIITELLANPAGSDTGQEFIELHNPADRPVTLLGCHIQTSANSKRYILPDIVLSANAYRSFDSLTTGLTLSNGGGSAWLASGNQESYKVTYSKEMLDDEVWALVEGVWQATPHATPGLQNKQETPEVPSPVEEPDTACPIGQERNPETDRCRLVQVPAAPAACKPGQERNPETNRCRNIPQAAVAVACKPDETRNPDTNRCNKNKQSTQTACKPNQTRNPDTGRCKNAAATSAKQPCAAGQVRNPTTGRCKKDTGLKSAAIVKDVRSDDQSSSGTHWKLLGIALAVAIAYAAFEWRQDLRQKFSSLLARVNRVKTAGSTT